MGLYQYLAPINEHNFRTLRDSPLEELSGALGDLGTLLPLMVAMALKGSIDLPATLVFSGLTNIYTGVIYGVPLPVQPMKAIAAVAISQSYSKQTTMAAGLSMGIAVFVLSSTGLLRWLNRIVPVPIVRGIQVGAGLSLLISAGTSLILPLQWTMPAWDNRIWAIGAFVFLVFAALIPRLPYAIVVFGGGFIISAIVISSSPGDTTIPSAGIWHPKLVIPHAHAWRVGVIDAAIPQLPLTTLNSILAVTSLSAALFPNFPPAPTTTSLGFSVSMANLVGCWFGAMPICHGSGGLAGQYRFGARSGASIIILGLIKLVLGLLVGESIVPLLQRFPKSLLGVMVLAAGVELAKVGQSVSDSRDLWEQAEQDNEDGQDLHKTHIDLEQQRRDRWTVMLITTAGCLAFKNDAVGFLAGLIWHWSLNVPTWIEHMTHGSIRLSNNESMADTQGLLDVSHDAAEGHLA